MANLDELMLGMGEDADKAMEAKAGGAKVNYFRLKDGETARVLFVGKPVTFLQHNDYNAGIKSHACIDPKGANGTCPSCKQGVKRSKKSVVPLWNIESGQLEFAVWGKKEYAAYKTHVENYGTDEPAYISVAGKGTEKVMTVGPIPPKQKNKDGKFGVTDEAKEQAVDADTIMRAMFVLEPAKMERLLRGEPISDKAAAEAGVTPTGAGTSGEDDDVPF